MTDIEKLKEELREELRAESSHRAIPALETIRKKWFTGPDSRNKYCNSLMGQAFGNDQHRVWDAVRTLTRIIFSMKSQARLAIADQKEVERILDSLCETVYKLKESINEKEHT